jgi:Na+-driven multidrug efflux pump
MRGLLSKEFFSEFILTSAPLIGSQIAMVLPVIACFVLIGSIGDTVVVTVYGLSYSIYNMFCLCFVISILEVAGANCAKEYGADNYRKMASYFYKTLSLIALVLIGYYFFIQFTYEILVFLNIEHEVAVKAAALTQMSWLFNSILSVNMLLQTYLMSQDVITELAYLNLGSILIVVIFGKVFIVDLAYREIGIVYTKLIQEVLSFIYLAYLMLRRAKKETLVQPSVGLLFADLRPFLKKNIFSLFGVYGEYLAFEINTFFAAQLHNVDDIAAWYTFDNFFLMVYFCSLGISNTFRTRIGQAVGEGRIAYARKKSIAFYFYTFILSNVVLILSWSYAEEISRVFLNNDDIIPKIATCIRLMSFYLYAVLVLYSFFAVFRILNMDRYFFQMSAIVFPVLGAVLVWIFGFGLGFGLNGIVVGQGLGFNLVTLLFFIKVYYQTDWEVQCAYEKNTELLGH